MIFHTLAFALIFTAGFILRKIQTASFVAKKKSYTTVTIVPKKLNPHPVFLPELIQEIQSYLDLISLGRCRLINSEWSNIAATTLKKRIHEFEDNHPTYRPSHSELLNHVRAEQIELFDHTPNRYLLYNDEYKLRYHIEDLMLSNTLNKKILDVTPEVLGFAFDSEYIYSAKFPYLMKMRFCITTEASTKILRFVNYAFNARSLPLTVNDIPAQLQSIPGCIYEAVIDLHANKAYNIRLYNLPDIVFGIFPGKGSLSALWLFLLYASIAILGDIWQLYYLHQLLEFIMVFIAGYFCMSVVLVNPALRVGGFGSLVYGLVWHRLLVHEVFKYFGMIGLGYMAQRILWNLYHGLETNEIGKKICAGIFFFQLFMINDLKVFSESFINGGLIWSIIENTALFLICLFLMSLWAITRKPFPKQLYSKIMLLRFYSIVLLIAFYNPYRYWTL